MPMPRKKKSNRQRSKRAQGTSSSSSSSAPPPMAPALDLSRRPLYAPTRYWSPWCPPLRTKAWLAFHGLPPHLRTLRTCEFAVAPFGGVVRFHVARDDGRVVVEARVTRVEDVPRRIEAQYHIGFGHLLLYPFDIEVLVHAPVGDGDETQPPGALIMMVSDPGDFPGVPDDDEEEIQVGQPRRVTFRAPKPEECAGILEHGDEARGAVERPESSTCQAFSDD